MVEFTVFLEDVQSTPSAKRTVTTISNQRTKSIDAADINDAWVQARHQWYTLKVDGPYSQIVDIEPGSLTLEEWREQKAQRPIQIGQTDAPPMESVREGS